MVEARKARAVADARVFPRFAADQSALDTRQHPADGSEPAAIIPLARA